MFGDPRGKSDHTLKAYRLARLPEIDFLAIFLALKRRFNLILIILMAGVALTSGSPAKAESGIKYSSLPLVQPLQALPLVEQSYMPLEHPKLSTVLTDGNTYAYGNCTAFAKSKRPDLPNNLGNANTWYARASAQGFPVGSEPRVGAVGVDTGGYLGHVVYVEKDYGDGTIGVSEANVYGLGVIDERRVGAASFLYIY